MRRVGFAGLGLMGSRMAARLVARGYDVVVWDREPPRIEALVARGARPAADAAGVARDRDVVVTILWDDAVAIETVERTLLPVAAPGTTFIEMTTITPAVARRLAEAARAHGCPFLDAPVTGSRDQAESGELTALVGGPAEVLEAQRELLETLASTIVHVGPNGTSGALKLANNQLVALMSAAWGESIASAQAGGVDPAVALEMFAGTFARIATTKWRTILERDFTPKFTLDALYKDIGQALRSAQTAALALPLLEAVEPVYARAVAGGAGPRDFSIVVDLVANGSRRAEAAP